MSNKEPILVGRWHHGNGTLCSGTLRIARADFDTNPTVQLQEAVFQDICDTMNAKIDECDKRHQIKLTLDDCVNNLKFHGHDDAVAQVKYFAQDKFGIKL